MRKEERGKGNKRKGRIIKTNVQCKRKKGEKEMKGKEELLRPMLSSKGRKEIKSMYRNEMEKLLRQMLSAKGRKEERI